MKSSIWIIEMVLVPLLVLSACLGSINPLGARRFFHNSQGQIYMSLILSKCRYREGGIYTSLTHKGLWESSVYSCHSEWFYFHHSTQGFSLGGKRKCHHLWHNSSQKAKFCLIEVTSHPASYYLAVFLIDFLVFIFWAFEPYLMVYPSTVQCLLSVFGNSLPIKGPLFGSCVSRNVYCYVGHC